MKLTAGTFFRFTMLPNAVPQLKTLFASGFGHISYYIALVFGGVRLLPSHHAYLNPVNIGRFGIAHVVLEARRNLVFDRAHADQVALFFLVLLGLVLFVAQFFILGFALFTQFAHALPATYAGFFVTASPEHDIAFILMDRVFGIPGMFGSCVSIGSVCLNGTIPEGMFPAPYHAALHMMLQFYSIGLTVIGLLIFMYYSVAVLAETAQTGTPFGRRFNHVWAPIRMVVALGMIIPISYGLSGAQLLTLYMGKWGSSFATNGWNLFVSTLVGASTGITITGVPASQLVAEPNPPDVQPLLQFFSVVAVCKAAYKHLEDRDIDAYLVRNTGATTHATLASHTWTQALDFYQNGNIIVVFGEHNTAYSDSTGFVKPFCGEITLTTTDLVTAGARALQESYYDGFIKRLWDNIANGTVITSGVAALPAGDQDFFKNAADRIIDHLEGRNVNDAKMPDDEAKSSIRSRLEYDALQYIQDAILAHITDPGWLTDLSRLGWGGAGVWYNRIAELNGSIWETAAAIPSVKEWPIIMKEVAAAKSGTDSNIQADQLYTPHFADGTPAPIRTGGANAMAIAKVLNSTYLLWGQNVAGATTASGGATPVVTQRNALITTVNFIFGTEGLFNMRENADIYPLAQLVTMGKYMLMTAVRNLGISMVGGLANELEKRSGIPKEFVQAISGMASTFGMMTLAIGFILYYVLPFLPFMYFFFQVGGWIKALFEAMVGVPLWALAHLRIDGEGLPGSAGMSGYFLLFEIFLRPILIVFGLIGGISIFAAQVQVLNEIFDLVVANVSGYSAQSITSSSDPDFIRYVRDGIDIIFYTVIYVIIVYMMGMASFKLVYMIPDGMMRWLGSGVQGFGELNKNEPAGLVPTMYFGVSGAAGQLKTAAGALFARQ